MKLMDYQNAKQYIYTNMFMQLLTAIADDDMKTAIEYIIEDTSCDEQTAKLIWCDLKMDYGTKENNAILQARENYENKKSLQDYQYRDNAECPYCHSKNTMKISGLSKAGSVALWGVYAMGKVSKQWHCNNCKSDF